MQSYKQLLILIVSFVMAGCQTKPYKYEVETTVRPVRFFDERGEPRQYDVDIEVTETSPKGETKITRPRILTVVGKQAEIVTEELHTNQPPGRISCTALIEHVHGGSRVDTSVTIVKKGKEVCTLKQSTILSQYQGLNQRRD